MVNRYLGLAVVVASAFVHIGCVDYKWQDNIERAEQQAKAENKYMFVFYKWWLDSDCNRVLSDVVNQPDTVKLFQNTINCQVVYEYPPNRQYMAKHGIERVPGFMIKAPDGSYQKRVGYIPKEAFIQWASAALTSDKSQNLKPPPAVAPPSSASPSKVP